jgi:sec-independent protein translocase protein TatC
MAASDRLRGLRLRLRRRKRADPVAAMTVMEHLRELRSRLIKSLVAFVLVSIAAFAFYDPLLTLLRQPLCDVPPSLLGPRGCSLAFFKVTEPFQFRLKLTALVGIAVSAPIWLYQLYAFILPGLTSKERRYSIPFLLSALVLFAVGSAFAYLTLPTAMKFLFGLGGEGLEQFIGAEQYLNFVGLIILAFGVTFQLPLFLVFLGLAEIITVDQLRKNRRLAVVLIFVLSAVVTPSQDPYTMSIMALPLYGLYEVTILILSRVMRARERDAQAAAV